MHNGYLKSLKEVVHFYNTRDALPRCQAGDPGEKVSCWPAPEHPETMNRKQLGNLGLTGKQEDQIVAFMKTLTDGYTPAAKVERLIMNTQNRWLIAAARRLGTAGRSSWPGVRRCAVATWLTRVGTEVMRPSLNDVS